MTTIKKHTGTILLITALVISFFSYDQYGMSSDEKIQHKTGKISYNYIFSDNKELLQWKDRDYGVAFELPLIIIEKTLGLEDSRKIFLARHILTHIFFLISSWFCFLLIDFLYKNKLLAAIGFLFIVLHPRLYGHSFFNTKDIPFMSMYLICFYLSAVAFKNKKIFSFVLLGIASGLLVNIRIMGVLFVCCVALFFIIDSIKEKAWKENLKPGLIFLAVAAITLYVSWPFLWNDPFENFVFAFKNMSKFRWTGSLLFGGEIIKGSELDWNYIPVWFSISTPIFYLAAGFIGIGIFIINFFKKPLHYLSNCNERNNILFLICFFVPVLAVIVLQSVLYDGWRQLYFIYPPFVLLAVYGLDFIAQKGLNMKRLIIVVSLVTFSYSCYFMTSNYPLQHVYFNKFVDTGSSEYLRKNYELDYWGTSYKQSLEYILGNDKSPQINVAVANNPGKINADILPAYERKRINYVEGISDSDYFITNYKRHPKDYKKLSEREWHTIRVGNNSVSTIFKLK